MSTRSAAGAIKASVQFLRLYVKRKRGRGRKKENIIEEAEVRRRTLSLALGVESSESGHVPWIRLESVIRCIAQTIRSSGENFINDEGTPTLV